MNVNKNHWKIVIFSSFMMMSSKVTTYAQTSTMMVIEQNNGTVVTLNIEDIRQITFQEYTYQKDPSFFPEVAYLHATWLGEYEGWDVHQRTITKIKRLLTLRSDGTYTNLIQGVLVATGKTDYIDFEHEHGNYTYTENARVVTYTVESDSLLDFASQQFVGYTKKHYIDHETTVYTEQPLFTKEKERRRKWITRDDNLVSADDKKSPIVYAMDKHWEETND